MLLLATAILTGEPVQVDTDEVEIQELVRLAQRGGPQGHQAFSSLYSLYAARVYRTVRPLCPTDDDAQDVLQDTFTNAWRSLGRYRRRKGSRFVSWLLTIGCNAARKRWRHAGRTTATEPEELERRLAAVADLQTPERALTDAERKARLLEILDVLAPDDRQLLTLFYGGGLSAAEVGTILGMKAPSVRKRAQRLRERMVPLLAKLWRDE